MIHDQCVCLKVFVRSDQLFLRFRVVAVLAVGLGSPIKIRGAQSPGHLLGARFQLKIAVLMMRHHSTGVSLFLILVVVVAARYAAAWVPIARHSPISARGALRARKSVALCLTPRDLGMRDGEENEEEEMAAAAAKAAREALERMWASSSNTDEGQKDAMAAEKTTTVVQPLPELVSEGEEAEELEVRRENPFPASSERGAIEAAAASQKAVVAGKRGLIIDIEVKQLDDHHPEFEPQLLLHFVTEVSKALAAVAGKAKVMLRGQSLAEMATETLQKANLEGVEVGIEPRDDVGFCSFAVSDADDEDDPDTMEALAAETVLEVREEDKLIMMVGPRSSADAMVMRAVVEAAKGRPVLIINPKILYMPRETTDYETVYLLRQFNVQPVKTDPKKRPRSPLKISRQQRRQQSIFSEMGQVVPKVLTVRAFPDDFKLYLDIDGKGFQLEETYDTNPDPTTICLTASNTIGEAQREVAMQAMADENRKRQLEKDELWDDEDDDIIMPKKLTNEEIDAMLRD